jgi:hypothetical protein
MPNEPMYPTRPTPYPPANPFPTVPPMYPKG